MAVKLRDDIYTTFASNNTLYTIVYQYVANPHLRCEWRRCMDKVNEICSIIFIWNWVDSQNFGENTGPERFHASGAGRHAIKESGLCLIWTIICNKQTATEGEWRAIQTLLLLTLGFFLPSPPSLPLPKRGPYAYAPNWPFFQTPLPHRWLRNFHSHILHGPIFHRLKSKPRPQAATYT